MKIRYEVTIDDIVAFHRRHSNHGPHFRRGMAWLLWTPTAVLLAVGALVAADGQGFTYLAGGTAFGLSWALLGWLFVRWRLGAGVRRAVRDGLDRNWFCWHELELSDGMLVERSDHNTHATAVRDVTNVISSDSHTYVYVPSGVYVIPRRDVAEAEYQTFIDAIRQAWEQTRTEAIAGASRGTAAAGNRRCPACRQPLPRGVVTCRRCGRTWWSPVAIRFAAAIAVKAGAICGGLYLHDIWLSTAVAWGGSLLAGYILLAVVHWTADAFRTRQTLRRLSAEGTEYPALQANSMSFSDILLQLAVVTGFILVGNTIGIALGICLALTFLMPAGALTFAALLSALLTAGKRKLATRSVTGPEEWPGIRPPADRILVPDSVIGVAKRPLGRPSEDGPGPESRVELRVLCAGDNRFAVAGKVTVALDGRWIAVGSLRRGFDARGETTPGIHELCLRFGLIIQKFVLDLPKPGAYEADLCYSSLWACFYDHSGGRQ